MPILLTTCGSAVGQKQSIAVMVSVTKFTSSKGSLHMYELLSCNCAVPGERLLATAAHADQHGVPSRDTDGPGNTAHMLHGLQHTLPLEFAALRMQIHRTLLAVLFCISNSLQCTAVQSCSYIEQA